MLSTTASGDSHAVRRQHSSVHGIRRGTGGISFNPYAIAEGVPKAGPSFGDQHIISHLPASRGDAEHILRLPPDSRIANYSVGLMQITSTNFRHYGVSATELAIPVPITIHLRVHSQRLLPARRHAAEKGAELLLFRQFQYRATT